MLYVLLTNTGHQKCKDNVKKEIHVYLQVFMHW